MKKISILILCILLSSVWLYAQTSSSDPMQAYQNALAEYDSAVKQLERANLRSQKREIIRKNISLTPDQEKAFWPIYDKYEAETIKINDRRFALINDYVSHYQDLSNEKAAELINSLMQVQKERHEMKRNYVRELGKVIPAKPALRLLLIENQMDLQLDAAIAAQIPL